MKPALLVAIIHLQYAVYSGVELFYPSLWPFYLVDVTNRDAVACPSASLGTKVNMSGKWVPCSLLTPDHAEKHT